MFGHSQKYIKYTQAYLYTYTYIYVQECEKNALGKKKRQNVQEPKSMCQGDEGENRTHLDQNSLILGTIRTCPHTHTKKTPVKRQQNKTKTH